MSSNSQFSTDATMAVQQFNSLVATLDKFHDDLSDGSSKIATELSALTHVVEEAENELKALADAVDAAHNDVKQAHAALSTELEGVQNAIAAATDEKIAEAEKEIGELHATFQSEIQRVRQEMDAGAAELKHGFDEVTQAVEAVEHEIQTGQQATDEAIDQLATAVGDMEHRMGEAQSATVAELTGFHSELSQLLAQTVEGLFTETSQHLAGDVASGIEGAFGDLAHDVQAVFHDFADEVGQAGEHLISETEHAVEQAVVEIRDTLTHQLQSAFEDCVHNVVKEFAAEMAEGAAMMTAGAATTTALEPVLPELAAAKVATHVLKTITDNLPHFG